MIDQTVIDSITPQSKSFIRYSNDLWCFKNKDFVVQYCNAAWSGTLGFGEPDNVIGVTDYDIPCEAVHCAPLFVEQEKKVMETQKTLTILDIYPVVNDEWRAFITTKMPLFNRHHQLIGNMTHCRAFDDPSLFDLGNLLSTMHIEHPNTTMLSNQHSYLLTNEFSTIDLSDNEADILFYLLRGKSIKQIKRFLKCDHWTVGEIIDSLKIKFGTNNNHELIDHAIAKGFLNQIPPRLFKQQLSLELEDAL